MSKLVLYRKYRPTNFKDIAGQDVIVQTLKNELSSGNYSHAFLFCGPRGVGKTTTARVLAKALNCLDLKNSEPCNECANCVAINEGRAIDIIEIDAASNRGIDEIRELREGVKFAPSQLKYKVLIIDECHQLTKEASNALLKTLEEPPKHAIFILATTELHKMLPTISSRCQRFDFRKITAQDMSQKLEEVAKAEGIKIDKDALDLIALNAQGSLRDGEVLLDQVSIFDKKSKISSEDIKGILGLIDVKVIGQFVDFVFQKKAGEAIQFLNENLEQGYDPQEFAKDCIDYLRQAMLLKIDKKLFEPIMANFTKEDLLNLNEQIKGCAMPEIIRCLNLFLDAKNGVRYSPIPQLPLELAVVEFCEGIASPKASEI